MSFISDLTAKLPFVKKDQIIEHFFALNIDPEKVTAVVWLIEAGNLKIIGNSSSLYSSTDDLLPAVDKVLDSALGTAIFEPDKILFGVPDSWVFEDNLKEQYLNLLRKIVKELELTPVAYVSTSHALSHFLEKQEGAPTTAILVGLGGSHIVVNVLRAGKSDGVKVIGKSEELGQDIEKALASFTEVEVLPSRILIYGEGDLEKYKNQLLSHPWMQRLSFLHFPKIAVLEKGVEAVAISFAGAVEIDPSVKYVAVNQPLVSQPLPRNLPEELSEVVPKKAELPKEATGFVAGDVLSQTVKTEEEDLDKDPIGAEDNNIDAFGQPTEVQNGILETDFVEENDQRMVKSSGGDLLTEKINGSLKTPNFLKNRLILLIPFVVIIVLIAAYLLILKATVMVYVEPRVLEKDTEVTADPSIKSVDESSKKIPGEIVQHSISGNGKLSASGKKQIGDPAKGTVTIRNKTDASKTFSQGSTVSSNNQKFTLDTSVTVASKSAEDGTWGKGSVNVTAVNIGADGNIPSGTDLAVDGTPSSSYVAKAEGNFSGGTSKEATVVSDDDQKKLLATLASDLRKKAKEELQVKNPDKKILEEALSEEITKKSFSKRVGDQANEFGLDMTIKYKGTAYSDSDLRTIVSKLVETNVPSDFQLNLAETETQADVSKLEKDGRLIFLARFKAKLLPRIDTEKVKNQIRGRSFAEATNILKGYDNVLGSEIRSNLPLPANLQRLPVLVQNIKVETGLK